MKLFNIIKTTLSKNTNPFQRNKNLVHDMDQLPEFSRTVLNIIMKTTGKYPAETGGILGSRDSDKVIDLCCFDKKSSNTSASFYYDIESMSKVMNKWRALGYEMNGIFHSHPDGCIRPSYHDIASALLHMDFLKKDYFYLPIIQREKHGNFKLHFYMTKIQNENVLVIQLGTIFANSKKYISKITNESTRVIESHSV